MRGQMLVIRREWPVPVTILVLLGLLLTGCGGQTPTAAPQAATAPADQALPLTQPSSPTAEPPAGEVQTLRMALLPILDVLPFHVADQNGFFDQMGVRIELIAVKSAQERDTLMQTGQIDGMLADPLTPVLFNQEEEQIKVVRTASKSYPGAPLFRILAAPGSKIASAADLAGVEIGISQNTIIEYITARMLEKAGLTADQIATQEVSAIPVRFELLINGQIPAATLPDPLASGAIAAGARVVVDDASVEQLSQSILVFSSQALQTKPQAVRAFLRAWEMAVDELNSKPDAYRDLLIEQGRVPESIQGTFQMPPFPKASVPTPDQMADVVKWALDKGLVQNDVPYERMVDASFLP
jgi:NitT/TauT family transport system substrate-binding protein